MTLGKRLNSVWVKEYPNKPDRAAEIHCAAAIVMLVFDETRDRQRACGIVCGMMEIQEREDLFRDPLRAGQLRKERVERDSRTDLQDSVRRQPGRLVPLRRTLFSPSLKK